MSEGMAQRIKELRHRRGLTLEQVAEVVGVGKSTVRKWETGMIANMRRDKIADLAKALGTTPAYLMGWEKVQQKNSILADLTIRMRTDEEFCSIVEGLNKLDAVQLASIKQIVETFLMKA